jgi:hypothetical protein
MAGVKLSRFARRRVADNEVGPLPFGEVGPKGDTSEGSRLGDLEQAWLEVSAWGGPTDQQCIRPT